jgi:hypothetical protein
VTHGLLSEARAATDTELDRMLNDGARFDDGGAVRRDHGLGRARRRAGEGPPVVDVSDDYPLRRQRVR